MRQHAGAEPVAVHAVGDGHVLVELGLADDAARGRDCGAEHELDGAGELAGAPAHPSHPHVQITLRLGRGERMQR